MYNIIMLALDFSDSEVQLYKRRLEEGYDLDDDNGFTRPHPYLSPLAPSHSHISQQICLSNLMIIQLKIEQKVCVHTCIQLYGMRFTVCNVGNYDGPCTSVATNTATHKVTKS